MRGPAGRVGFESFIAGGCGPFSGERGRSWGDPFFSGRREASCWMRVTFHSWGNEGPL